MAERLVYRSPARTLRIGLTAVSVSDIEHDDDEGEEGEEEKDTVKVGSGDGIRMRIETFEKDERSGKLVPVEGLVLLFFISCSL